MTALCSWALVGFLGQGVFTARFLVQWIASERKRDSVVPVAFWWLSLVGGALLLAYAIAKRDPVFILGQIAGPFVFTRNLMLIARKKAEAAGKVPVDPAGASTPIPQPHFEPAVAAARPGSLAIG